MNSQEVSVGFSPCKNFITPSSYYYPQQSTTYSFAEIERNIMYLLEQNRLLQLEILKQKEQSASQLLEIQKYKDVKIKAQSSKASDQSCHSQTSSENNHFIKKQISIKKKKIKKIKDDNNQTKNIPKNYGKAIITFIESNKQLVRTVVSKHPPLSYTSFMALLKSKKKTIHSIADLRSFWLQDEQQHFAKAVRILSNIFLRYYSLEYIFNSRISNFTGHIKYRGRLVTAIKDPKHFTSIKQY